MTIFHHRQETLWKHFVAIDVWACVNFGPTDVLAHGHFVSINVSVHRHFPNMDILALGHYSTALEPTIHISAKTSSCHNVPVPKCPLPYHPCAWNFKVSKFLCTEKFMRTKFPFSGMSAGPKSTYAFMMLKCQNVSFQNKLKPN